MSQSAPEMPSAATLMPDRLGRFEVLRPLATGGMAEVLLARAAGIQGFEKLVVIKRILPKLAADHSYAEMFLNEARLMAALHHSNIVQIYEVGEADGSYFMAMEFLDGVDVRAVLRAVAKAKQRIPLEQALTMVSGLVAGIAYAHAMVDGRGEPMHIVHRDISPTNVFVTFDGNVKVVDFGIAKARTRRGPVTEGGVIKGKFTYMSPEQAKGVADVDGRSDLFSIGIVLWELLTLRGLYPRGSDYETLTTIVQQDAPPPSRFAPEIPPELDAIVLRALARDREKRYATGQEMLADLEEFARHHKLVCSPLRLSAYLRKVFPARAPKGMPQSDPGGELVRRAVAQWQTHELTPSEEEPLDALDEEPAGMSVASASSDASVSPRPRGAMWLAALTGVALVAALVAIFWPTRNSMPPHEAAPVEAPRSAAPPAAPPAAPVVPAAAPHPDVAPTVTPASPLQLQPTPPAPSAASKHPRPRGKVPKTAPAPKQSPAFDPDATL